MRRSRTIDPIRPARTGRHDGLAYGLWLPGGETAPAAGVLVLHGAGSQKESHQDFARAAIATGLAVLVFDQRGHGESEGALDGRMLTDVTAMAELLRGELASAAPIALRGSSMGGFLAILAAQPTRACRGGDLPGERRRAAPRAGARSPRRCCCSTPRVMSRFRSSTRANWRRSHTLPAAG